MTHTRKAETVASLGIIILAIIILGIAAIIGYEIYTGICLLLHKI